MAATRSMMSTSYTIPPPVSLSATWMGLGWGLSILRTGSDLNHYYIMYFFSFLHTVDSKWYVMLYQSMSHVI